MYLISNRHLCSKEKYIKTIVEAAKNNIVNWKNYIMR